MEFFSSKFQYLPLKFSIAKTVLRDQVFGFQKFERLISRESCGMVGASVKIHETTFVDSDILPSNRFIAKILPRDLDLLFQGQIFERLMSLKWGEVA